MDHAGTFSPQAIAMEADVRGDFSRDSYDRSKCFTRVLFQQGKVVSDADLNEQAEITADRFRQLVKDFIGSGAGPSDDCGFAIVEHGLNLPDLREEERLALAQGDLLIMPGTYYVDGLRVRLENRLLYSSQCMRPSRKAAHCQRAKDTDGDWFAYLEVWEEYVAPEQDVSLVDPALHGAVTAGRALTHWTVKLSPASSMDPRAAGRPVPVKPARMRAKTIGDQPSGYTGLRNCLYRVEIHSGNDEIGEVATFKWSRENGSIVFPVSRVSAAEGIVIDEAFQFDEWHAPKAGESVELFDADSRGREYGSFLARVARLGPDNASIMVEDAIDLDDALSTIGPRRWFIRKWDHLADREHGGAVPISEGVDILLENGVVIEFEPGGQYRRGDYWLIPARPSIGNIIWETDGECLGFKEPHGPERHIAPLALREDGRLLDLRQEFSPLSRSVSSG